MLCLLLRESLILARPTTGSWKFEQPYNHNSINDMPLINGYKYSCEPCIRGHRATSCAHTDRILVEVRKPGRPLESCGHQLDTCSCGRLQDLFTLPGASLDQSFSVESQSSFSGIPSNSRPKQSSSKKSVSKVSKKTSKKKEPSMQSPTESLERGAQEYFDPVSPEPQECSSTTAPAQTWNPDPVSGQAHSQNFVHYEAHQGMENPTHDPVADPSMTHGTIQNAYPSQYPYQHAQQYRESDGQIYPRSQYCSTEHEPAWASRP
ncbi:copper fist DNA binding domain-containing protein [Amylocarpus encephaloides]|uniref:Copper fist DNA binding domain-containing protein n=1 Tax=Amylocarpus encephaloides TaxID=45428 RepID=A0A9P8C9U0_9HELO|nr:copper fist DNA binding domain-containing protein [Amylocarpus encephaloides]